ncbi:hypothetical protein DPMN_136961 [Dreissena polymorpha]|uniref:Uncharacterized protein n=1 Tax=Dreissena polymorpha TaxID=45954 RepID=A0A9D4G3U6_DREPO|nr:hypothetical protein DPMN_136961 [Dreissena polymorpha]
MNKLKQEHRLAGADRSSIFFLKVKGLSFSITKEGGCGGVGVGTGDGLGKKLPAEVPLSDKSLRNSSAGDSRPVRDVHAPPLTEGQTYSAACASRTDSVASDQIFQFRKLVLSYAG